MDTRSINVHEHGSSVLTNKAIIQQSNLDIAYHTGLPTPDLTIIAEFEALIVKAKSEIERLAQEAITFGEEFITELMNLLAKAEQVGSEFWQWLKSLLGIS